MLSRVRLCTAGIILSGLGGCVSPPTFVNEDKNHTGPPVEGIFAEIRCELLQAIKTNTELVTDGTPGRDIVADPDRPMVPRKNLEKGKIPGWTANMQLTLQLDENAGLTPSVSSIMPYTLAAFNLTFNAFGNFSTSAQRIYGQALTVKLRNLVTKSRKNEDEATVNEDHGLSTLMDNGKPSYPRRTLRRQ